MPNHIDELYEIDLTVKRQPDEVTCGPTCLHSIYRYYNEKIELESVINEVSMNPSGGTLAAHLGVHALKKGYKAEIWNFNLNIFDPSWFQLASPELMEKLALQNKLKRSKRLRAAANAYIDFLKLGGKVNFEDLTPKLLQSFLMRRAPIIVGLSATYLYRCKREIPATTNFDDLRGVPSGHFVILTGITKDGKAVRISDPYHPNPYAESNNYPIAIEHLICSILLGVVTYDATLLLIEKKGT